MRWALLGLLALTQACAYAEARGRDFMDCFRLEGALGPSLQADVQLTQLLHLGVGSSNTARSGFNYGVTEDARVVENHLPGSLVISCIDTQWAGLHQMAFEGLTPPQHRCNIVFPGLLDLNDPNVVPWHFFDVEAGLYVIFPGVRVGFSPGEFVDFILGFWTYDLAGDDDVEGRMHKYYRAPRPFDRPAPHDHPGRREHPPEPLPWIEP